MRLNSARTYTVTMETNCGTIRIGLDVQDAPKTTASFAYLVKRGFYNGLTFHRVVRKFVVQGGDPNGTGTGGPGYRVVEPPPSNLKYTRGVVAMAKTAAAPAGASGSQFFIVTAPNADLPPEYALVGLVLRGSYKAVEAIASVPTKGGPDGEDSHPTKPIVIERATLSVH